MKIKKNGKIVEHFASYTDPENIIYTPYEASKILKCEESTVYGLMNQHKIAYIKIGKHRRIKQEDLNKFINELAKKEAINAK